MFKKYAYGGTYDLAVVKFGATKDLNRDEIHVPSKATADSDPNKRKRKLREIETIVGMSEGEEILLLCTDGGVLFYDTTSTDLSCQSETTPDLSKSGANGSSSITELETLQYNPDIDMAWALGRLGPASDLMLLRAIKRDHESYLETSLISGNNMVNLYISNDTAYL